MSTEMTMLENLIVPQVMGDMISAKLQKKLMFKPLAVVDTTLVGVPGNVITIPKYAYIGDAKEVAEGAKMGIAKLETSSTTFTIKKIGKAVTITDEAVLSGYGNPVGEAENQLTMAIASKIDADCADALQTATLICEKSAEKISYDGIVDAIDLFNEEDQSKKVMLIHSKQLTTIRKDPDFLDKNKYPADLMMTGAIGTIAGAEVVVSNRVKFENGVYFNPIVKLSETTETEDEMPALKIFMKQNIMPANTRDNLASTNTPSVTEHYGVALTNDSKVVIAKFKGDMPALATFEVVSVEGTETGKTILTVSTSLTEGNTYKYKTAANPTVPTYGAACTTGYTSWDGVSEIVATAGQKIVVVEVDGTNKAIKGGLAVVTSKA